MCPVVNLQLCHPVAAPAFGNQGGQGGARVLTRGALTNLGEWMIGQAEPPKAARFHGEREARAYNGGLGVRGFLPGKF